MSNNGKSEEGVVTVSEGSAFPIKEYPLPELSAPSGEDGIELAELREEFPPADFGSYANAAATVMTKRYRLNWQAARRSRDRREEELDAKKLRVNLRFIAFVELFLSFLVGIFDFIPNCIKWFLERTQKNNKFRKYIWLGVFALATALSWIYLSNLAAVFVSTLSFAVFVLWYSTRWIPSLDWWDEKSQSWIDGIEKKQSRMNSVRLKMTAKIDDILARTEDHLERSDSLVFEEEAMGEIVEVKDKLEELKERYKGNRRAQTYLRRGKLIMADYVQRRAFALWQWERKRTEVDENAATHRWDSTVMATIISSSTAVLRIALLTVTLFMIPVAYNLFTDGKEASTQINVVEVAKDSQGVFVGEDVPSSDSTKVILEQSDEWSLAKKLGITVFLAAISAILIKVFFNIFTRIIIRHLQYRKVKKKNDEDSLDCDCQWKWIEIQLSLYQEESMNQVALSLDGIGLTKAEKAFGMMSRKAHHETLSRLKLQYERKTGKKWLEPTSSSDRSGAIFDSGAPEEAADPFIDSLFDLV